MKKTILYILFTIMFIGCMSKKNDETTQEASDQLITTEADTNTKNAEFKVGDIVDEKYRIFGLGEYDKDDLLAFYVKHIVDIKNYSVITFVKNIPCTPTACPEELEFFLLKEGTIISRKSERFNKEEPPSLEIIHDTFIQYLGLQHNWYEDENGVMTHNDPKGFLAGIRLVIWNDKLHSIDELSKPDLNICRNLIFARYGYIFKSEDLNQYFLKTEWYKPMTDLDIENVLTETDKELISYIKSIEERKK